MYGFVGGYVMDEEETNKLAYDIFSRPSNEIIAERESQQNAEANAGNYNDAELTIQVLNGGYANGMATTQVKQELEGEGYNVSSIGTYSGEKISKTRIYVKEDGMGQQLKKSFDGCEVVTDPTVATRIRYCSMMRKVTGEYQEKNYYRRGQMPYASPGISLMYIVMYFNRRIEP